VNTTGLFFSSEGKKKQCYFTKSYQNKNEAKINNLCVTDKID
jgi:hypothetical protein